MSQKLLSDERAYAVVIGCLLSLLLLYFCGLSAYFQTKWTQIRLLTTSDDLNCLWRTSSEIYFKMIITSINKEANKLAQAF